MDEMKMANIEKTNTANYFGTYRDPVVFNQLEYNLRRFFRSFMTFPLLKQLLPP